MDPSKLGPIAPIGARLAAAAARAPRSKWADATEANPNHSAWYVQRFRDLAASGADLVGEARLIDAMAPRGATVLDAGCGPGRHAGYLHERGHTVVGVDLDPVLIEAAEEDFPGPRYLVGDLATFTLPPDVPQEYDLVFSAGNVMGFLHPDTRRPALVSIASWLAPQGRAVIGFGAGRGYAFDDFFADAAASGMSVDDAFSTWDLRPYGPDATFLVAVLSRA
ncbi:class I SAM-dependent methyltransferase [Propioniciclava coleopterorum]|uniref:Class I SAM-dependent methyltransferase n=1 Tax=Propioniciclava coleopterorum TaxID=2714937 RepID=A0A6G7Y479_9ACTN|nr:class I SAM-dependent methyltransferase [Propioniciclava coleopterorum]QIK71694.1 class I SAM-dependent methyltransferase [Propioniciclava coleopterorum]